MKYLNLVTIFLLIGCYGDFQIPLEEEPPEELSVESPTTEIIENIQLREDGEPCTLDEQCIGGHCLRWPGGYCTSMNCRNSNDCSSQNELIENICIQHMNQPRCYRMCQDNQDCREGYTCRHERCIYSSRG